MLLSEIVKSFPTKEEFNGNINVLGVEFNLDKITDKCLYFCLKEDCAIAFENAKKAINLGAVAIVTKFSELKILGDSVVVVENVRKAFSNFCANFYNNPEKRLKIIGVIGTNGKTSTCKILQSVLNFSGKKTAYIGTLGAHYQDYQKDEELTTPDPNVLFKTLDEFCRLGVEYVAMEYSAHAIYFDKLDPINFECLIFTNCTQDHLDFFKEFSIYEKIKALPFESGRAKYNIINTDDNLGLKLNLSLGGVSYGIENPSDVFAVNICENVKGVKYVINLFDKIGQINLRILGKFNVYNTLAVATCAKLLGVNEFDVFNALALVSPVSGRLEKVAEINGASVFIDYAHTPDGLEKSLLSARNITEKNLYCVFGCGGNRDNKKRPIMGRIAGDICDFVVLTNDNPRFEDAMKIINEIERGLRESTLDYICIQSRKKAIIYALKILEKGDTLLIAGKGSEEYQDILGVKHEFSDKKVVLDFINND